MNKYQEAINYFKDFEEGDNITVTCDFCTYVEALEELVENILYEFIYLDCNKEVNYKNMTGEQVVNDYNKVIERLLDRYNIRLDNYYVRSDIDA